MSAEELLPLRERLPFLRLHRQHSLQHLILPSHAALLLRAEHHSHTLTVRAEAATSAELQQAASADRTLHAVDHTPSRGRSPMHAEELLPLRERLPFLLRHRQHSLQHLILPSPAQLLLRAEHHSHTLTVSQVHATSAALQQAASADRTLHAVDHTPSRGRSPMHAEELLLLRERLPFLLRHRQHSLQHLILPSHAALLLRAEHH